MNRRMFAQQAAAAMVLAGAPTGQAAVATDRRDASREQPNRFSVMLWTLAKQVSFEKGLKIVSSAGYSGVELTGEFHNWSTTERQRVLTRLNALGLTVDSMSGVKAGFAVAEQTGLFRTQFAEHLQSAQQLSCTQVILLSGKRVPDALPGAQRITAIENLKRAGDLAAKSNVEIVIEPIDLLEDPTIYLASVTDAFDLARAVGMPNVKVLYDFYHEQRSFGNLLEKLEHNIDLVGLVHVADVPGRHDPGTGEINYSNIYRKLALLKYRRRIAMEFYPVGDPVTALRNARESAEASLGGFSF